MTAIRRDINQGGVIWTDTLLWYAKAVAHLYSIPVSQRGSWRYLAAIHGINIPGWISDGVMNAGDPMPPSSETDEVWNQCQHGTWYFLPWHRGYLASFESIVAKTIADLGGPKDWALPYWNYLDASNPASRNIPPAFMEPKLPDGSENFLAHALRNGESRLGPMPGLPSDITLACMDYHRFTGANGALSFGGGVTAFAHGSSRTGACESNPHNLVHVMVGGLNNPVGFMSDPDFAALDPIFWVHHCNIDRLWAAWLTQPGNIQENGSAWSNGPAGRGFAMPDSHGQLVGFAPGETLPGGPLAPIYDNLTSGTGAPAVIAAIEAAGMEAAVSAGMSDQAPPEARVLGSTITRISVGQVIQTARIAVADQGASPATAAPQRYFLNLEGIRGSAPSGVLTVRLGDPSAPAHAQETVALFGLAKASDANGPHGGNGLGATINVTAAVRALLASGGALGNLPVSIEQPGAVAGSEIIVGRVSLVAQDED